METITCTECGKPRITKPEHSEAFTGSSYCQCSSRTESYLECQEMKDLLLTQNEISIAFNSVQDDNPYVWNKQFGAVVQAQHLKTLNGILDILKDFAQWCIKNHYASSYGDMDIYTLPNMFLSYLRQQLQVELPKSKE